MDRITRDQMLMLSAFAASLRGSCRRLKVGAVLSFEARPVSWGYNGPRPGAPHCGPHCDQQSACIRSLHAEDNAIKWAKAFGIDPRGSTLHVTDSPCGECARKIVEAGVSRVVYDREYRITEPLDYLKENRVEVERCHISPAISATFAALPTTPAFKASEIVKPR